MTASTAMEYSLIYQQVTICMGWSAKPRFAGASLYGLAGKLIGRLFKEAVRRVFARLSLSGHFGEWLSPFSERCKSPFREFCAT